MFVKICGLTSVDDSLLAAGLGADALGFNFFPPSKRFIAVDLARDIVKRLPPEVLAVGIFRNELPERVVEIANVVGLRAVQLHGHESPAETRWVGERVPAMIRAFSIDDPALVSGEDFGPHRLMVDAPVPGSGEAFDWGHIESRVGDRPYVLAGGLDHHNVGSAITALRPWGVDVASGVEEAPGRKDPAKVRKFIVAAREAADNLPAESYPSESNDTTSTPPTSSSTLRRRGPFDWE